MSLDAIPLWLEASLANRGVHEHALGSVDGPPEAVVFHSEVVGIIADAFDEPNVFLDRASTVVGRDPLRNRPLVLALLEIEVFALVLGDVFTHRTDHARQEVLRVAHVTIREDMRHRLYIVEMQINYGNFTTSVFFIDEFGSVGRDGSADVHWLELGKVAQPSPVGAQKRGVDGGQEILLIDFIFPVRGDAHEVRGHWRLEVYIVHLDLHVTRLGPRVTSPRGADEG